MSFAADKQYKVHTTYVPNLLHTYERYVASSTPAFLYIDIPTKTTKNFQTKHVSKFVVVIYHVRPSVDNWSSPATSMLTSSHTYIHSRVYKQLRVPTTTITTITVLLLLLLLLLHHIALHYIQSSKVEVSSVCLSDWSGLPVCLFVCLFPFFFKLLLLSASLAKGSRCMCVYYRR